jgi:hypothetical protein
MAKPPSAQSLLLLLAVVLLTFVLVAHFLHPDPFKVSAYGCDPRSPDACYELARFRDLDACHEFAKLEQSTSVSLIRCAPH